MSGVGYNPYRKANGQFASKDELGDVETKVTDDLWAAQASGDKQQVAEIEQYIEEKLYDTKTGAALLEQKYGATARAQSAAGSMPKHRSLDEQNMDELESSTVDLLKATDYLDSRGFDLRERHGESLTKAYLYGDPEFFRRSVKDFQESLSYEETNFFRESDAKEYEELKNLQKSPEQVRELSASEAERFEKLKKDAMRLMQVSGSLDDRGADIRQSHGSMMVRSLMSRDVDMFEENVKEFRQDLASTNPSFTNSTRQKSFDEAVYGKERSAPGTVKVEGNAKDLQPGDRIYGQKFTDDGRWVDNVSEPIKHVQPIVMWDHKRGVSVEYADNTTVVFYASENMRMIRPEQEDA